MKKHKNIQKNIILINALVKRELTAKYKQSIFGKLWIVLQPFLLMIVLSVVFSRIVNVETNGIPYPVFLYAALLPWTFFTNAVGNSTGIFTSNASLLKQRAFFRPVLIVQRLLNEVINFVFSLVGFVILILYYHVNISEYSLFVLPVFCLQIIFVFSLMLIFSTLNVYIRDVSLVMPIVLRIWFYLSPVIYSKANLEAHFPWLFYINPMAPIIDSYRQLLFYRSMPDFSSLLGSFTVTIIIFLFSIIIHRKLGKNFADVL